MTADLYALLNIDRRRVISNPPAPSIAGFVYVMHHYDDLEKYWYYSVNHQSLGGDTGWQSERIYNFDDAQLAADVLASFLEAEVVPT